MNSYIRINFILSLIVLLLTSCGIKYVNGSGRIISETRSMSGIEAVSLAGSGDLTLVQGETESLSIEADDNLLPHIKTEVQGGRLTIGFDREDWPVFYRPSQQIRFILTVKDVTALDLSGSGNIKAEALTADHLALTVSGSGDITIGRLDAAELTYILSGSGDADIAGQVTRQDVTIGGSGDYQAGDMESQAAQVDIGGSGNVTLWAQDSLEVSVSGSGSVNYYGSPEVTTDNSGSGDINSLGDK